MKKSVVLLLFLTGFSLLACSEPQEPSAKTATPAQAPKAQAEYTFSVVPQQSASKSAAQWIPLLASISEATGVKLVFETRKDIPEFERTLSSGLPDLAYMNPYHYVVFHESPGYEALARAKDKRITGIMVARKGSDISGLGDLDGMEVAFPAPAAFAATLLPRAEFARKEMEVTPRFVSSHDSVYRNVASGTSPAGGGVVRTFKAMPAEITDQLQVIWTSEAFTPHAIAAHPRVPREVVAAIRAALVNLHETPAGAAILEPIKLKGFELGKDADWDDVRALNLEAL
jgi:phosphonate transport system substrate-binding protein